MSDIRELWQSSSTEALLDIRHKLMTKAHENSTKGDYENIHPLILKIQDIDKELSSRRDTTIKGIRPTQMMLDELHVAWNDEPTVVEYFYVVPYRRKHEFDNSTPLNQLACPNCGVEHNSWLKWRNINTLSEKYPVKSPFGSDSHCVCVLCQTHYHIHDLDIGVSDE